MATERELQVACLWGLHDRGVLVVKGSFDDSIEAAVVACIKAYVEKHMHHNLLDVSFSPDTNISPGH
ncbi:uncharacterized protein N7496_012257 [Penicillium cataractarum]|uniref:Uncharacterized protein n=1 Tax=Penicillium cataractarum TaxID=2100454 RepID=A0A9W9UTN5_9EURO|nr:uncharacterized protein N7496_012257 [Penicillium cataractarum]KAJ5355045.1 hypothetical protein N7496_012257 [Penicillium cataractarum]